MRMVHGQAQHYAWGDRSAIPTMLGQPSDGRPWAEWWLGTHVGAPSTLDDGRPLGEVSGDLPYLLKLLAAAEPLSLQTHPKLECAQRGFAREEALGVPIDAPQRIYRDPFAKPELLCALQPFDTLCGFRPTDDTVSLLHEIDAHDLAVFLQHEKLAVSVTALYRGEFDIATTLAACRGCDRLEASLVNALSQAYPNDPSVVVTLLLNRLTLEAGDAVFLGPGNLHAYLRGVGVEIMGSSDNVVRGGLTAKHVDIDELLAVLDFQPLANPVVRPVETRPGHWRYDTLGTPFRLWRFEIDTPFDHQATGHELLLWTAGERRGDCAYLSPGEHVRLTGPATVFRVEQIPTTA
jgi:mannose-6-phosphate isomerase